MRKTLTSKTKAGAGGNWKRFDEKFDDSIPKQFTPASCVSAVGEMLGRYFGLNISQTEIHKAIGDWSNSGDLARYFNEIDADKNWIGGHPDNVLKYVKFLLENRVPMCAVFREGNPLGHAVFIEGLDKNGSVIIKDPFDQTEYKMKIEDVFEVFSETVFKNIEDYG